MTKKVTRFIVYRSKWLRGTDRAFLLDGHQQRCCVGFYAHACGLSNLDLYKVQTVSDVVDPPQELSWMVYHCESRRFMMNSSLADEIYEVNDSGSITDSEREAKLKELFSAQGIKVEFRK